MKIKYVSESGANLNSVITPFLDMAFQILGFFVMIYHPSALEGHIDGRLLPPEKSVGKGSGGAPNLDLPPLQEDPIIEDHYKVLVRAVKEGQVEFGRKEGEPSQMFLVGPQDPSAQGTPLADADVPFNDALKKLKAELATLLQQPGGENTKVRIVPDGNLKYLYVMEVYDVCRTTEIDNDKGKKKRFAEVSFVGPSQ